MRRGRISTKSWRRCAAGRIPTDALNTHRASLDDAPAMFPVWMKPESGVIKAIIEI